MFFQVKICSIMNSFNFAPTKWKVIFNVKCIYDEQGSIGKRYYRQDEAGTPFGITIDHETLDNNTVTIRERDSMEQHRISLDKILEFVSNNK